MLIRFFTLATLASVSLLLSVPTSAATVVAHGNAHARAVSHNHGDVVKVRSAGEPRKKHCRADNPPKNREEAPKPNVEVAPKPNAEVNPQPEVSNNGTEKIAVGKNYAAIVGGVFSAGIGWRGFANEKMHQFKSPTTKVLYTWTASCPKITTEAGFVCACMLHDLRSGKLQSFRKARKNCKILMAFNEPNLAKEANLSPQTAAAYWKSEFKPFKAGKVLVLPACAFHPGVKDWYKAFFKAAGGIKNTGADIMALHMYSSNAQSIIDYVTDMYNTFGLPIWITETDCREHNGSHTCSHADAEHLMRQLLAWCHQHKNICHGIFWFGASNASGAVTPVNAMMDNHGNLNRLGQIFVGRA